MSAQAPTLDLSDIAVPDAPPPARVGRTRPAVQAPATPAPPAHPAGAYDSNTEGDWSLERDAPKVKDWFRQTYNSDLPVTAYGESATHRRRGLDHTNSMDVGLNPASERGQSFLSYLRQNNIPFLAYDRAVRGAATGPHVHVGFESRGLGAPPRLNLEDIAESSLDLSDIAEKPDAADAPDVTVNASQKVEPQTTLTPLPQRQTPDVMTQEGRSMRDARSQLERTPGASLEVAVPLPASLDGADAGQLVQGAYKSAAAARGVPGDFFDSWVKQNAPTGYSLHGSDGKELTVADAMKPDAYDEKNRTLRVRIDPTHLSKIVDDYKLDQLRAVPGLEDAKSLDEVSPGLRALTVDSETTSPGEKFLAVTTPVAHGALRTADIVTRPLQALDAGFWAKVRGARDPAAVMAAYQKFFGGDPELGRNVIAEGLRNSDRLRAINPKLPSFLGELANIVVEPSNLALIGGTAAASKLLGGAGRVGEAARGMGLMDRGFVEARPLGLGDAAFGSASREPLHVLLRGEDGTNYLAHTGTGDVVNLETGELVYENGEPVNASPNGGAVNPAGASSPAGSSPSLAPRAPLASMGEQSPELRAMAESSRRAFTDPLTGERIEGTVEPISEYARSRLEAMGEDTSGVVKLMDGEGRGHFVESGLLEEPHHSNYQPRTPEGQFDGPPEYPETEAASTSTPEQPLHEYLEELTGKPAPDIQPKPQPQPSLGARIVNTTSDIINAPKSIKSSIALHGPFRQGVFQAAAHPTFLQDAISQQVKAFASESAYRDFAQGLTERPWFKPMQDAGLFMPSTYDVEMGGRAPAWLREERFASAAAEKIPGVRASSRAYVGAMDSIRSQAVEHYLTTLYGPEMDLAKADPQTLKALAEFVNISTGRGTVPILDRFAWGRQAVAAANNFLWSPRALSSRANLVSPIRLMRGLANPATRPVALLQAHDSMRAALSVGATLSLLSLVPGVKVGLNPYKPGWGMVKVGNTEYDILDGVPSTVKYAAQVGQALYRHAEGKPPAINRGGERTVYNLTADFLRKRLSPSAQVAAEALTGKNAMGEGVTASQSASDLLTPFTLEEMYKAWSDAGGSSVSDALQGKEFKTGFKGAAKGLPSAVGIPTRTYQKRGEPLDLSDIAEP